MANTGTGLAFSGGGIRSAAFCSGVLRKLLKRGVEVDFLSCVSGGGYTGAAYLDWKYREERKKETKAEEGEESNLAQGRENDWHKMFFNHMTQRSGYICNWMEPLNGILDTIVLSFLVMLVTFIQPIIKWGSYACPVAFMIDFFFGKLMRDEPAAGCDAELAKASNSSSRDKEKECLQGTDDVHTVILFLALFILFSTPYVLLRLIKPSSRMLKIFLQLSQYIFGSLFVLTFIPFTIYDFFNKIPLWAQFFLAMIAVLIWIVLPLLRTKTSYVLIIYFFSYVIYWKVYQSNLFGLIAYSESIFRWMLGASGIALWLMPLVSTVKGRVVHVYNRWRLQKAFYHKNALGPCGCAGIRVQDISPLCGTCLPRKEQQITDATRPLTLADLKGMKPEYLSNMVVNRWQMSHDCKETYELLTMSPTGMERIDRDSQQFKGFLEPEDVMLSDAMATSAAAVSTHMGKYEQSITGLTRLHTILDLEMGATMVTKIKSLKQESLALKITAFLIIIFRGLPLIAVPILSIGDDSAATNLDSAIGVAMLIFLIIHTVLAFIALIDTGDTEQRWWQRLARWLIVHSSFVHYAREMFAKNNIGPVPPPILLLSDGGHVENLGILPLLKRRLSRIVVVDGGYKSGDTFYGESILNAMHLARIKLKCSFLSKDGRDVISDLREKLATNPRYYKFKVYYQSEESGDGSEGEILLIIPKNPQRDVSDIVDETAVINLHGLDEPEGMSHDDVSKLTLCCCECCHRKSCQWLSKILCNVFPQTNTANQFFTPRMFLAYHHEGYQACAEANADDFLRTVITERQ